MCGDQGRFIKCFWGTCGIFTELKERKKKKKTKKKRGFSAGFSQFKLKNCHSVEMNKSVNNEK